ncbi:5-(carboxyamino)imidazole ribonucleotide synthase [Rhodospirillum centenum]|uniref:N5-carboxyaminoimidazole ribonucleotide synthase n=1 Tax=Rhodospirillum centenum (strain ATCC 51521 / SW) TaxID=414684 RepID=B6INR1_RHOCS|nr:5-(carboxyamino)imidazole ribonucleotide synthase [Rhodospirillum centenum]ACI99245.1 phosphoribosylaminoimidazole carboxylase, ATPase subunit [Rhodospirillum centenum SW]
MRTIAPGATLGMLGGGQLGRMTALAAARLGYRTHVLTHEAEGPCAQVAAEATIVTDYTDRAALTRFAAAVDVVTLEWENIPTEAVAFLAERVPVHPGAGVLAVAQDRLREKGFANALGIGTAPFRAVRDVAGLADAVAALGTPSVLKSTRMGYDGKGQVRLAPGTDLAAAWAEMGAPEGILEGWVDFALEVSVIVARREDGEMAAWPAVENRHRAGILDETLAPADIAPSVAAEADRIARALAEALGVVGLLAVEMFVTRDGTVLVNEIAPRPHNSGHWTMDFAETCQFEQLVRAVCGLPLGPTGIRAPARMKNLIGDEVAQWPALLAEPGAKLHLYGKAQARPGRKMGHVNRPR